MEDLFVPIVSSAIVAILAIVAFRFPFKKKKPESPSENPVHSAASEAVQEAFKGSVERVDKAVRGRSAADDLAALGNARKRG